jgi:hypothetical protein
MMIPCLLKKPPTQACRITGLLALALAVSSCASNKTLMPALRTPEDMGLAVRFEPALEEDGMPHLALLELGSGNVLARAESLFTPDVVRALGVPSGQRLIVHASLSGDTIAAWENASDAYPVEQVVLFKKLHAPDGATSWQATDFFPPSRHGTPSPTYGRPATVDDEFLYYSIEDDPDEKIKWTALKSIPMGYKFARPEEKKDKEKDKEEKV